MKTVQQHRYELFTDPSDKRHGTARGVQLGCMCEKCQAYRGEYNAQVRERKTERAIQRAREGKERELKGKEKYAKRKAKLNKDVCTIPDFLKPLMGRPNIDNAEGVCCVCGAPNATNKHHIVKRSQGKWIQDGREIRKPTVRLCGNGNASGCHKLAHDGRLHFRFVPKIKNKRNETTYFFGAGHWEFQIFDKPRSILSAWEEESGWNKPFTGVKK